MSIRRMMLFTLGGFFKSIISLFKTRVLSGGGNFEAETNLENQLNTLGSDLFNSASLVITPNGVKTSKLYTIKPNDGTGDLSVIRNTSATRVNEQGLVEIPRTNLLLRSEEFDNAYWVKFGASVTANNTSSPSGTMTADLVVNTSAGGYIHNTSFVGSTGSVYSFSFYIKNNTSTSTLILVRESSSVLSATINWSGANISSITNTTGSISSTALTNGWFLIKGTYTAIENNQQIRIYPQSGSGTNSVFLWGAQLEVGNVATEYIPTTSVIRTRFAGITQDGGSASNIPRIDYTSGSPAILVEPQRTNLFIQSSTLSDWGITNIIRESVSTDNPFGVNTVTRFTENNIDGLHQVLSINTINPQSVISFSFYVKNAGINSFSFGGNWDFFTSFDLTTGVFSGPSVSKYKSINMGNGWWRVIFTDLVPDTVARSYVIRFSNSGAREGLGIFIYGAQLEAGSNATSYIPTTTSAVTRNVDVISNTNAYNLIGQTEGTLYWEGSLSTNVMTIASLRTDSGIVNGVIFDIDADNRIRAYIVENNVPKNTILSLSAITFNSFIKIAYVYKSGNCSLFINGVKQNTSSQAFAFNNTISRVNIDYLGYNYGSAQGKTKYVKNCIVFPTILTDAQCISLTTL